MKPPIRNTWFEYRLACPNKFRYAHKDGHLTLIELKESVDDFHPDDVQIWIDFPPMWIPYKGKKV